MVVIMMITLTIKRTRSVAVGFGRHGMPPPAANGTGTALGLDGSDWSRDIATSTFDLGGHAPVADTGRRPPSVYQVWSSQALPFERYGARCVSALMGLATLILDLLTLKLVCESHQRLETFIPNLGTLGFRVLELFDMYATDGRTDGRTDKS